MRQLLSAVLCTCFFGTPASAVDVHFRVFELLPKGSTFDFGGLVMTLEDAFAPEYAFDGTTWSATGRTLFMNDGVLSNSGTYTLNGESHDSGVRNPSILSTDFENTFGPDREDYDVNAGEGVVFSFDQPVKILASRFIAFEPGIDSAKLSAGGLDFTYPGVGENEETISGNIRVIRYDDPFSGVVLPAGTPITIESTGDESTDFVFYLMSVAVVPEPSAIGLAVIALLAGVSFLRTSHTRSGQR